MKTKTVSVIIPAFNEEKGIGLCLESLAKMDCPPHSFEVIVVDNGSTDRTIEVARSYSESLDLKVLQKTGGHVSAVRNFGAEHASGSVFAFLDADCLVPPQWLNQAVQLLSQEGVGVVGAHFQIPQHTGWVARTWYGRLTAEKQGNLTWVPACNTWVGRELFERLGGFDASIETSEDCEFCTRVRAAGFQVIGQSDIAVVHLGTPARLGEFYSKISWHATDGLRVFLRDPMSIPNAMPVLFGLYTLLSLACLALGIVLAFSQKRLDIAIFSFTALCIPSLLLSTRLVIRRKKWADLLPLMVLNLVYGLARGRSLLVPKNWRSVAVYLFLVLSILSSGTFAPTASAAISGIWVNSGEDKVTRDELRLSRGSSVANSVWDGTTISIFGGRNEVVSFNVILEGAASATGGVSVTFNRLANTAGAAITSTPAPGNGVFNWTQRPIELFYVRYLQIKGLSKVFYETYDERHVPQRMRRPWSGNGSASGSWTSRPDHDKYYPDIAVPLELVPPFSIAAGTNQSIWVDIYIPKGTTPGLYRGNVVVRVGGTQVRSIPVQLNVVNLTLPDMPSAKTMLIISPENINQRYIGSAYVNPGTAADTRAKLLRDRHFQLAHRHRISLIGDDTANCASGDSPCPDWLPRLNGSLFTAGNGYDGPGVNTGNNVYSIGTYGTWNWQAAGQAGMQQHSNAWVNWFENNSAGTEYFLYLIDESANTAQIQSWAQWILSNPGPGQRLKSLATLPLTTAASQTPSLDIPTTTLGVGVATQWQALVDQYTQDSRKRFFMYNARRPATGSFATEDDGVSLRELVWAQYKKRIQRWFFWEATYYNNNQGSMGQTNVFQTAQTFGTRASVDNIVGENGWNYSNGDGVLMYPGTDTLFPADSYGVEGPFASLRLKHWRRGIQDADYLTMAAAGNPTAVQALVNAMVPRAIWEYGADNNSDPTYVHSDISWSNNPDLWEHARAQLAGIITGVSLTGLFAPILNLPPTLPVTARISATYPPGYIVSTYQWTITPSTPTAQAPSTSGPAAAPAQAMNVTTPNAAISLATLHLELGAYQITVTATDPFGRVSPPASALVTLVSAELSNMRVYPKPWRSDRHRALPITFDNLTVDVTINIFTVSGHHVKKLTSSGGRATWDLKNDSGDTVASGIYLYVVKTREDHAARGQLTIIR